VGSGKSGVVSFNRIEERVHILENNWQELNLIPTNSELFRRVRKLRQMADELEEEEEEEEEGEEAPSIASVHSRIDDVPMRLIKTGQPVHDMWQSIQVVKQIEKNTEGIDKVCC